MAIKPGTPRRARHKPKTIAQGMPECSAYLWFLTRVLSTLAHEAAGATSARHSLRPLSFEGARIQQNSGAIVPREGFAAPGVLIAQVSTANAVIRALSDSRGGFNRVPWERT